MLAVITAACCYFSVGYSYELYGLMCGGYPIEETEGKIIVDGTDFTPLAELAAAGTNGFIIILTLGSYIITETLFIVILSLLLRLTIRKKAAVLSSEVKFPGILIALSSLLAFAAAIVLTDIRMTGYILLLSWQQPLFMMLVYFLPLKKRSRSQVTADGESGLSGQ